MLTAVGVAIIAAVASLAQMRAFYGLLVMSGPDDLVAQARELRHKDMLLHHTRFELDAGGAFNRPVLPPPVAAAASDLDHAIEAFAAVARRHTS